MHHRDIILGQGSYGQVTTRDGKAVKKFKQLSHLIQESLALQYLTPCNYIVHAKDIDFSELELHMELFDCNLRHWIEENRDTSSYKKNINILVRDIIKGLVELHERGLTHGDLKPGNILIRKNSLKAVLGDCGFVSVSKYAKVNRTAAMYRDPVITHDTSHDMYSLGICLLEMLGNIRITRQGTYAELKEIIHNNVADPEYRKIIYNLVHENKDSRPSAKSLLYRMYQETPNSWSLPGLIGTESSSSGKESRIILSIEEEDKKYIQYLMHELCNRYHIRRGKKGYGALVVYVDTHKIASSYLTLYAGVTALILSSIFGATGFNENDIIKLVDNKWSTTHIYKVLKELFQDTNFITILLSPERSH